MSTKQTIVDELGAGDILTPDKIVQSLGANDQVKYYFALLQTARSQAEHPNVIASDLKVERRASQIADAWLDDVVANTRKQSKGAYAIPHAAEIIARIEAGIATMLACLPASERAAFDRRFQTLTPPLPEHDVLPDTVLSAITSGDRQAGDSLHLVVMDAHRAINRLQTTIAVDILDGAYVSHLSDQGRKRVQAFMRGLNRTAPLKFDHPGLGTTATEHDGKLLIQNDIGTTDAHVLIIRVDATSTTVTYTDIHRARLKFFCSLLAEYGMVWESAQDRRSAKLESGEYILSIGRFDAQNEERLQDFLTQIGSRIVFLIDWNHMRKQLATFIDKPQAVAVLKWAADHDIGHRALIEVSGEQGLGDAVEYAAGSQLRYGVRLDHMIDADSAVAFFKEALRLASTGLQQRRSHRTIMDEIKAKLRAAFEHERLHIFDIAAAHAAIGFDIATGLVEALGRLDHSTDTAWVARFAVRAEGWEKSADQLLNEARADMKRFQSPPSMLAFMEHADDAVDELEEAAALIDLLRLIDAPQAIKTPLNALAELSLSAARELVRIIECAASVTRSDVRDDLHDFMRALETLVSIEHQADTALRQLRRCLIEGDADQRQLMVLRDLAQAMEAATDAYTHSGQALRAYLMEEVIA